MNNKKTNPTEQIEKLPDAKEQEIKHLSKQNQRNVEGLIDAIESAGLQEFIEYIRSPWKMLWPNFVAGVARGVGALIGAALVIALIGWILTKLISLPLIGQQLEPYVKQAQTEIKKYTEATNYKEDFTVMRQTLTEIRDELQKQRTQNQNLPK